MFNEVITQKITKTYIISKSIKSDDYIGFQIKKRRTKLKMTQFELSQILEVSRSSVSNMEVGRHNITLDILEKLCLVFNCKSFDLLGF